MDAVHVAASLQTAIANRLVLMAAAHSMEDNSVSSAVHRLAATHITSKSTQLQTKSCGSCSLYGAAALIYFMREDENIEEPQLTPRQSMCPCSGPCILLPFVGGGQPLDNAYHSSWRRNVPAQVLELRVAAGDTLGALSSTTTCSVRQLLWCGSFVEALLVVAAQRSLRGLVAHRWDCCEGSLLTIFLFLTCTTRRQPVCLPHKTRTTAHTLRHHTCACQAQSPRCTQ